MLIIGRTISVVCAACDWLMVACDAVEPHFFDHRLHLIMLVMRCLASTPLKTSSLFKLVLQSPTFLRISLHHEDEPHCASHPSMVSYVRDARVCLSLMRLDGCRQGCRSFLLLVSCPCAFGKTIISGALGGFQLLQCFRRASSYLPRVVASKQHVVEG